MKKTAVINDISGFGKCSMTAAIPVISVMGIQACPLPTAVLSNQTGYPEYFCDDFSDRMEDYIAMWRKLGLSFDSILTGYIANEKQIEIINGFCKEFKKKNTLLVVDPVMADNGSIYATHSKKLCDGVKSLAMQADIITPNLTEFCVLTGCDYKEAEKNAYKESMKDFLQKNAKVLIDGGIKHIVVTSVPCIEGKISNCIIDKDGIRTVSSQDFGGSYSGTGDLFSAAVCAGVTKGEDILDAVSKAVRFLECSVKATVMQGTNPNDGICFEPFLKLL